MSPISVTLKTMALINIYIHIFQTNFSYFILLKNLFLVVKVLEMSLNKCSMNVNMSNKIVWHNTVHGFWIEKLPESVYVKGIKRLHILPFQKKTKSIWNVILNMACAVSTISNTYTCVCFVWWIFFLFKLTCACPNYCIWLDFPLYHCR